MNFQPGAQFEYCSRGLHRLEPLRGLGGGSHQGWIGHNGSLPGYEPLVVYLPAARATMAVTLNTDILHDGVEPGTLFGQAITQIVSPDHVYNLPVAPTPRT